MDIWGASTLADIVVPDVRLCRSSFLGKHIYRCVVPTYEAANIAFFRAGTLADVVVPNVWLFEISLLGQAHLQMLSCHTYGYLQTSLLGHAHLQMLSCQM